MAKLLTMAEASTIVEQFRNDPNNPEVQVALVDATRRFPIAMMAMMGNMHGWMLANAGDSMRWVTLRKYNSAVEKFDKKQLAALLKEREDDDEVDTAIDEQDEAETTPKRGRKKVETIATDELDISALLGTE